MSKDYPCIHYDGGKCKHFSDDKVISYCVQGPCGAQVLSNADRLRTMSDEELAAELMKATCPDSYRGKSCDENCELCWLKWLQQPAEEVQGDG